MGAAALCGHEDAHRPACAHTRGHLCRDLAHHRILEHQSDGRNQHVGVLRGPAHGVFPCRTALRTGFEHGGCGHGVCAHTQKLRALRQLGKKRGNQRAADAAALAVQHDNGHKKPPEA